MRYLLNKTELKTLNYILSLNENNQINEGLIDRVKNMAAKGLLTATVVASLMSNPAFAKEYKSLDTNTKSKIEKLIKTDKTDHSDSSTHLGGPGGPLDTLSVDFNSNFSSGKYILDSNAQADMKVKLDKISDFIKNTGKNSFILTIYSSESRVPSDHAEGELAKLRAEEVQKVVTDYNKNAVFKVIIKDTIGSTPFDREEANRIGMKKAVNLKKYTDEQSVRIELVSSVFTTPCKINVRPSSKIVTSATDYSETTTINITNQVGEGEITLEPGGIPDRAQIWIDGTLIGDTGYFVDGMTSQDANAKYFNYMPRYVAELTKVSKEKGMFAVKDSSQKRLIIKHFDKFEDLVDFMLTPEAKANGFDAFTTGKDTGDYMKVLKDMWGKPGFKGHRDFVFYDTDPYTTGQKVKLKFKMNGKNKKFSIKIFSPLGKTDYQCNGRCVKP